MTFEFNDPGGLAVPAGAVFTFTRWRSSDRFARESVQGVRPQS